MLYSKKLSSFLEEIFITNLCKCNVVKPKDNEYINITPTELFSASDRFSQKELQTFLSKAYSNTKTLFDI